jgi:hypothetical protein
MQATDPTSTTRNESSDQATIFVSLELSRAVWLVTALLPGVSARCAGRPARRRWCKSIAMKE